MDLRADPFEYALKKGNRFGYDRWHTERMFTLVPSQAIVAKFLGTFKEFPPRMKPASFSVGDALSHMQTATQGR